MNKITTHLKKHKIAYISGASGIVVGSIATIGILYGRQIALNEALTVSVNSPKTNVIIQQLSRRGHPGNVIRCVETGESFASQNRAANLLGISRTALSEHLRGASDSVNGLHFEKLGEAAA